jgi:hypothetical protein
VKDRLGVLVAAPPHVRVVGVHRPVGDQRPQRRESDVIERARPARKASGELPPGVARACRPEQPLALELVGRSGRPGGGQRQRLPGGGGGRWHAGGGSIVHGPLRLYCEVDGDLLLDASICDEGLPDTPPAALEDDWTAFVQSPHGTERYLADVIIEPPLTVTLLAAKLRDLVDAVSAGERPVRRIW